VLGEGHGVAEGGEPFGVIAGEPLRVQAVEVVAAQLAVRLAVPQDVVGDTSARAGSGMSKTSLAAMIGVVDGGRWIAIPRKSVLGCVVV